MTDQQRPRTKVGGMFIGVMIMLFGVTLLLGQAGVIDGPDSAIFWPLVVITVGLVKLSHPPRFGRRHGGWWVFFGCWMLVAQTHLVWLHQSWPLLLVAIGINLMWKELVQPRRAHERVE
jgi:hypothetical protein